MSTSHQLKVKIFAALMLAALGVNFAVAGVALGQKTNVGATLPATATVETDIGGEIKKAIGGALVLPLFKMLQYALNKVAYDAAEYIATGDKAKGPLFWTEPGNYFKNVGDEAIGEGIVSISDSFEFFKKYKINLCIPPDPKFQLWLKYSLAKQVSPPYSRCKLSTAIKSYQDKYSSLDALKNIGVGLAPGENELSMAAGIYGAITEKSTVEKKKAEDDAKLKGETKPPSNPVDDKAAADKEKIRFAALSPEQQKAETKAKERQSIQDTFIKGEYGWGTVGTMFGYIASDVSELFLNTAVSKLLAKYVPGGLLSPPVGKDLLDKMLADNNLLSEEGQGQPPRPIASSADIAFGESQSVKLVSADNYNYIGEMADCSRNSLLSCLIDSGLQVALSQAELGQPLTIKEAMDNGTMLHGDWLLKGTEGLNAEDSLCQNAYCYSKLAKLRFWRIFPVGMEMAAKISNGANTLVQVVNGFNTTSSPFYKLVNPDWIIKAPLTRCGALGYGSFIEKDTNIRQQYCAQPQHCINEDDNGNCIGESNWGYCLREKNIWRLGADKCDAQFNTCTLYSGASGSRSAYLDNTISRGVCNADNAGCRAYSVAKNSAPASAGGASGDWDAASPKSYFNRKAEICDAQNEGCSKFLDLAGNEISLKKAPAYAGCYGETLSFVDNWPQNKANLYQLDASLNAGQKQECGRFASVCSKEEAGCEFYKSADSAEAPIPGSLSVTDRCDSQCVGYAKYKEQKLTLFSGDADAYFIAETAKSCPTEAMGCEAFVNLDAPSAGGETKEYYTELRACSKTESEGDTFYTWEGSDTAGYQLKSYRLKAEVSGVASAPASLPGTILEGVCDESYYARRNETGFIFDADCREFYNRNGAKSYRLYSRTITVSPAECQMMRAAGISENTCATAGGEWNGSLGCVYTAIPQEGKSCSAEFNGCRAYRGNTGHNFQSYLTQNFQGGRPGQALGTNQYSAEALEVNGVSLKVNNEYIIVTSTNIVKKSVFTISFWAKGSGNTVNVSVYPSEQSGNVLGTLPAGVTQDMIKPQPSNLYNDWRPYTVGPFVVDWDSPITGFKISSASAFFLDNIIIKKMTDNVYVIKDSWKTPAACDTPVAQYQLGCRAYTDSKNTTAYAKSFTNLCRPEAVGCQELIDVKNVTGNTTSSPSRYFNALCEIVSGGTNQKNVSIACKDNADIELCLILPGKKSCRFNYTNRLPIGATATATAPAFTVKNDDKTLAISNASIVYLVNNAKGRCATENQGCRALGLVEYDKNNIATSTKSVYLKDQPDKYGAILCQPEAERCEEFTNSRGGKAYFVDPALRSGDLCEWKVGIASTGGWVKKGTDLPCYGGTDYGIRPFGGAGANKPYGDKVGLCPEKQDGCSEFIDPMSTDQQHDIIGTAYYVINDDEKLDRVSCNRQVSKEKGCILFNETRRGVKLYDATAVYAESAVLLDRGLDGFVTAHKGAVNNANVVLKVKRDRVCSEWLSCASFNPPQWDDATGRMSRYCSAIARCNKPGVSTLPYQSTCGSGLANHFYSEQLLSEKMYKTRYTVVSSTWEGEDYSGYTQPYQYSPEELTWMYVEGGEEKQNNLRLVKKVECVDLKCGPVVSGQINYSCTELDKPCGTTDRDAVIGVKGICKNHVCVQTPEGLADANKFTYANQEVGAAPGVSCRTYPEMSSPAPNFTSAMTSGPYSKANFCSQGGTGTPGTGDKREKASAPDMAFACDCNYDKRTFGGVEKYLAAPKAQEYSDYDTRQVVGICVGGTNDGGECVNVTDPAQSLCGDPAKGGGTCLLNYKENRMLGWKGACLQYDHSRKLFGGGQASVVNNYNNPCVAWWPVDTLTGVKDGRSSNNNIGFSPLAAGYLAGPYYCVGNEDWKFRVKFPKDVRDDEDLVALSDPPYKDFSAYGSWDCDGPGDYPITIDGTPRKESELVLNITGPIKKYFDSTDPAFIFKPAKDQSACSLPWCSFPKEQTEYGPAPHKFIDRFTNCNNYSGYEAFDLIEIKRVELNCGRWEGLAYIPNDEDGFLVKFNCSPIGGEGWVRGANSLPRERGEKRCSNVIAVGDSNDNSKALTDRVWKKQQQAVEECKTASPGALTINVNLSSNNVSPVALEAMKCKPGTQAVEKLYNGTFGVNMYDKSQYVGVPSYWGGKITTNDVYGVQGDFAKFYGGYTSNGTKYAPAAADALYTQEQGDRTKTLVETDSNFWPPQVHALGAKLSNGQYAEDSEKNTFSVMGQKSGDIPIKNYTYVPFQFFYHANKNQMPIRKLVLQADYPASNPVAGTVYHGYDSGDTAYLPNYRGYESISGQPKPICQPIGPTVDFDKHEGVRCISTNMDLSYMYSCKDGGNGWVADCPADSISGGCCVFKPRLQIMDNWEWCAGTCETNLPGGVSGCYGKEKVTRGKCIETEQNAWINYPNMIIVSP